MKTIFLIQDVKTREYFSTYRCWDGFTANVSEAYVFNTKELAVKEIEYKLENGFEDVFAERFIEIKEYISFN